MMVDMITVAVSTVVLGAILGFVTGRAMDIYWRTKLMRSFLKKEFGIMNLVSKDQKTMKSIMVNFGNDLITVGKSIWVIDSGRIYRQDKQERGATISTTTFTEGVPTIFVDIDNITPLAFEGSISTIKPDELCAFLNAWVTNQLAKAHAEVKSMRMLVIVCIIVAGLAFGMAYLGWQNTNAIGATLGDLVNKIAGAAIIR